MNRLTNFYKTYFKELSFVAMLLIVTAFLAAGTICAQLPNPPQIQIWVLVLWVAIFCVNIVSLSARAQTHDEVNRARWVVGLSILATFLPLAILYLATALVVQTAVFLLIVGLGAVTAIIAEANFTRRDKWISFITDLRDNHPYEYLQYLIRADEELTEKQQIQKLHTLDAKKLVCQYIRHHYLCTAAELELLNMPYAMDVLGLYFSLYNFDAPAQVKMFTLPNAVALIELYIRSNCEFYPEGEEMLLEFTDSPELLEKYVDRHQLSPDMELKLFDLPEQGFIKRYAEQYPICGASLFKAQDKGYL